MDWSGFLLSSCGGPSHALMITASTFMCVNRAKCESLTRRFDWISNGELPSHPEWLKQHMHRPARLISNKKKRGTRIRPCIRMHAHGRARTHTHTPTQTRNKRPSSGETALKTHRRTHTHRGRQVFRHITGSVAHIGMDYHIVTLRLTPTDNKLYRDARWGRRKEAAKGETWRESRRGRGNKQHTRTRYFMPLACVGP